MILVKPGVAFDTFAPAGALILDALKTASTKLAIDLTITSGTDGMHSGPGDPHHTGEAYDVRSHDMTPEIKKTVLAAVMAALPVDRFYGFLEWPGEAAEHLHFQRAQGTRFGVSDFLNA